MWYEVEWLDANSLARKRRVLVKANLLTEALKEAVSRTLMSEAFDSCQVIRVAGPPPDEK